ncbi:YibE/F family protein [Zhenpiania hominis]|uniref:YibE/F family protein n=1 Tax=Zhenpiania hominis TaxID=2763644 RepID=A0A923NKQ7_9FIRM|nr:YibE/F family protein [Zhenpiania hominis]MBC6678829.1 YibE/F family protein [Zhenpiania hominis]
MLLILAAAFVLLVLFIGGDRTAKALVTLAGNASILAACIFVIYQGANPLITALVSCLGVTLLTLFYQNEVNQKTVAAFWSVAVVIALLMGFLWYLGTFSSIQGFPVGQYEIRESNGYAPEIGINMCLLQIAALLMLLIGAIIDTALAVTSALYEVHLNNPRLSRKELFFSGISVGKDILGSTINTLFFIFMAEYFTLFLQFMEYYSFEQMVNSKEFAQEVISIALCGSGCVLILPVAALLGSFFYHSSKIPAPFKRFSTKTARRIQARHNERTTKKSGESRL